jgi:hypothetical protein
MLAELERAIRDAEEFVVKINGVNTPMSRQEEQDMLAECNNILSPLTDSWGRDQHIVDTAKDAVCHAYDEMWVRIEEVKN